MYNSSRNSFLNSRVTQLCHIFLDGISDKSLLWGLDSACIVFCLILWCSVTWGQAEPFAVPQTVLSLPLLSNMWFFQLSKPCSPFCLITHYCKWMNKYLVYLFDLSFRKFNKYLVYKNPMEGKLFPFQRWRTWCSEIYSGS